MGKGRLEIFTDGVIAVIVTIMVLEIGAPPGPDFAALSASLPILFTYALSFLILGSFWSNHHHMLHAATGVDGKVLWANLFLLFWLSLIPFVLNWIDKTGFKSLPIASYGFVLLMAAIGYHWLQQAIIARDGRTSALAAAVGHDFKGKLSIVLYIAAIGMAFLREWAALSIYVVVTLLWLIPDRRIEGSAKTE